MRIRDLKAEAAKKDAKTTKVVTETVDLMLNDMFTNINDVLKVEGPETASDVSITLLSSFVTNLVYNTLKRKYVHEEDAYEAYEDIKHNITQAISTGFESAAKAYSGLETEYYCKVQVVPEPINKIPC